MLCSIFYIGILPIVGEFISGSMAIDLEKVYREKNHRIKINVNRYVDTFSPAIAPFLRNAGFDPIELPRVEEKLAGQLLYNLYNGKLVLLNGTLSDFSDITRNGDSFIVYDNKTLEARGGIIIRSVNFKYDYVTDLVALQYYGRVVGQANNIVVWCSLVVDLDSYYLNLNRLDIETKGNLYVEFEGNVLFDWIWNAITRAVTEIFKRQLSQVITIKAREYISQLLVQIKNKDEDNQIQDVTKLIISTVG